MLAFLGDSGSAFVVDIDCCWGFITATIVKLYLVAEETAFVACWRKLCFACLTFHVNNFAALFILNFQLAVTCSGSGFALVVLFC